ncbi:MAG TPA: AarF/ABC1/UbiB kinase family protein [Candidatus Binatia bacterium]|nr:AarF/ABC1/UbiB kinase family protein [Candidatus Binatia bacterium]
MADLTSGRARRMLSVGRLTTSVGGSYLWQALKRPFQSTSRADRALLEAHVRNAQRIVSRSKELRGAFMKLTQLLSMRGDLFPAEALEVLSIVQSSVPPLPYARVREVIAAELGGPPETRFRRFEPEAFAAASLGQVHRAETRGGDPVAVKVQYPGVADTVEQDLKNVRALLRVLAGIARDVMRQDVDVEAVAAELEARLHEELDYRHEACNLALFGRLLADDPEVVIPRVYPRLSTRRVLTMGYADGYPLQDILAPGVEQTLKDWVAVKLFRLLWRQLLEFGALHADPHPGNYRVTHHPRLVILDFGSVRIFEPAIRRAYLRLARGLLARDDAEIGAACVALGFVHGDPAPLVAIMHIVCEPLERDERYDPRDYDLVARGEQVAHVALAHRVFRTPGHHVFLVRALMGLDGYLKALGTVRNWHRIFRDVVAAVPADQEGEA